MSPLSSATTLLCSSKRGPRFHAAPPRPLHVRSPPTLQSAHSALQPERNSSEEREGERWGREGCGAARGRPASVAPIAEADLLLVSVSEDVGFAREFGEHSVQPAQVVVELLFQVLLAGVRALQVAQVHQDVLGLPGAALLAPRRRRLVKDPPLDVVADGLEQHVVAVHVPGGREKAAIGAAGTGGRGRALLQAAATAAYLHADVVIQPGLGQGHVAQQAGHHHRLVHVVHGTDEAVHGVKERVLLVVGVADLHHGGRAGAEAQGRRGTGWPAGARECPPSRAGGLAIAGAAGFPAPLPPSPTLVSLAARPYGMRGFPWLGRPEARDGGAWSVGRALAWLGDGDERDHSPG